MRHRSAFAHGASIVLGVSLLSLGCGGSADGSANGGRGGGGPAGNGDAGSLAGGGRTGTGSGSGASSSVSGPGFMGTPGTTGFHPLAPGCGPETAQSCTNRCETASGTTPSTVLRPPATLCFGATEDPTPNDPMAIIEQVIEEVNGQQMVHLRVTFDPGFVDNTYGENAVGWSHDAAGGTSVGGAGGVGGASGVDGDPKAKGMMPKAPMMGKSGHTFEDLVGSDHVELLLTDGSGTTVMDFDLDYITASSDASAPCGYRSLGVRGGEGKMIKGDASAILAATSSLDRNLSGCGYCLTTDSPATDENYTPNSSAPEWDYRVVYEVWLDLDAFGASGFGQAYITSVHASPSKLANNTVSVTPGSCPPTWDTPYCPPGATDANCMTGGSCPPNYQLYVQTEGQSVCTPIPFANYPDMAPCPQGYQLDPSSEGRYCIAVK